MEEELSVNEFDCVKFIEKHINGNELDLTDLVFSVQLIQQETEDQINKCGNEIEENRDQIILNTQQLFKSIIDFREVMDDYVRDVFPQRKQDDQIYEKLDECLRYKSNISESLEMLEIVMRLEDLGDLYYKIIEDQDTQELYNNVVKNIKIFQILLQLPKMNPRYGQIEQIINQIEQYCHTDLFNSKQFALKIEILNMLGISSRATSIYIEQRVQKIDFSILERNNIQVNDAQEIVHQMIKFMDDELQYLRKMKQFQSFLYEFIKYLINYFNKHVFKQYFHFENFYNRNLDILFTYLTFYKVVASYVERGYVSNLKDLLKLAFEPYGQIIRIVIKNESIFLVNNLAPSQGKSIIERLESIKLNNQHILEQSFKRTIDLTFHIAFEDWIFECIKTLDNSLMTLDTVLNDLQLDAFGLQIQSILNNKQLPQQQQQNLTTKFSIQSNLALFEALIVKHLELNNFKCITLVELDSQIKQMIEDINEDDVYRQISQILREKLNRKSYSLVYQDNLSLCSSLRVIIEECENQLILQILRLMLANSLNQDQDYIHNFTTTLELIENIYKSQGESQNAKFSYKPCLNLCQLTFEDLEEKAKNNYFSQQTCFWGMMHILVEQRIIKIPELKQVYDKFVSYD